jgi:putative nucleotidyltransferase with HDIG domain
MERSKQFIAENFERFLVGVILIAALGGTYFIQEPSVVLNFYYLPVLVASYFLGRRTGMLAAAFSILAVILSCALLFPDRFFPSRSQLQIATQLASWGGFLILASVTVGTLYEGNERKLQDLRNAYVGILEILSKYLESTDRYTKGHSVRVAELAMETAIALGLHRSEVENIRVAGLLHDIGKIEVSGEVLRKAAELNEDERESMNEHAAKGARLLASVGNVLKEVVPIVLSHHKSAMGNPGSTNESPQAEVPLGARIVAVTDAFDAMTSDRPYRKGMPPWQALEEIVKNTGKQFDGAVVEAFKRVLEKRLEKI